MSDTGSYICSAISAVPRSKVSIPVLDIDLPTIVPYSYNGAQGSVVSRPAMTRLTIAVRARHSLGPG